MPLTEQDIELLESYLDDELSAGEIEQIRVRLAGESDLAEALSELRVERATRNVVWAAYDPSEQAVQKLTSNIQREMRRSIVRDQLTRVTRWVTAAAACVALSFMGGYLFRGGAEPIVLPSGPVAQATDNGAGNLVWASPDQLSTVSATEAIQSQSSAGVNGYLVNFTDAQGRTLGAQRFRTLQEAQSFMRDWQLRQQQRKIPNNGIRMVAEEF